MVKIQLDISEDLHKKVRLFIAKNEIRSIAQGVVEVLKRFKW